MPTVARFEIRSEHTGPHGRLGLPALCSFLQEAARQDAAAMGAGVELLAAQGLVWMMNRLRVEVAAEPALDEAIEVSTWPTRWERVAAHRDFDVRTPEGAPVALATSRWMIVDFATRRIQRLPAFVRALLLSSRPRALTIESDELPRISVAEGERRFEVGAGDLDAARHVNCARHVEWALASLPADWLGPRRVARFEIAFRHESVEGETVLSRSGPLETGERAWRYAHQLLRQDGAEVALAASEWLSLERPADAVGASRSRRAVTSTVDAEAVSSHGEIG